MSWWATEEESPFIHWDKHWPFAVALTDPRTPITEPKTPFNVALSDRPTAAVIDPGPPDGGFTAWLVMIGVSSPPLLYVLAFA